MHSLARSRARAACLFFAFCGVAACSSPHGGVLGDGGAAGGGPGNGGRPDGAAAMDQSRDAVATPDVVAGGGTGTPNVTVDSGVGGTAGGDAALDVPATTVDASTTPSGCSDGATRSCKDDSNLNALGNCAGGIEQCVAGKWGACSVTPSSKDLCSAVGDDATCNGQPNEGCPCVDGVQQPCGPTAEVGVCKKGTQTCVGATWGACTGAVYAAVRDCTSAADNNCDGMPDSTVDTVCACAATTTRPCDEHAGKDGKGRCKAGVQTCVVATDHKTSTWGACTGSVGPAAADACTPSNDDNCNGVANQGCTCVEGNKQPCGPTAEVGVCKKGSQTCAGGAWGACVGAVFVAARDCTSMLDNDCDGHPDNTVDAVCACLAGATQACGQHPGQDGKGSCKAGSQACVVAADKKSSAWATTCTGAVGAKARDCTSAADNDCSGLPDNQDSTCACPAGTSGPCAGNNNPPCKSGTRQCILSADKTSTSWSTTCTGQVLPAAADTCSRGNDANCNMMKNEGCQCINEDPPKACPCGTQTCTNGRLNACVTTCAANQTCSSTGQCACSGALTSCNGACIDLNSDPKNCGTCGDATCFNNGMGCSGGQCTCVANTPNGRLCRRPGDVRGVCWSGKCVLPGYALGCTSNSDCVPGGCTGSGGFCIGTARVAGQVSCSSNNGDYVVCSASDGCSYVGNARPSPVFCGTNADPGAYTCDGPNDCSAGSDCCGLPGGGAGCFVRTSGEIGSGCPSIGPGTQTGTLCDPLAASCPGGGLCVGANLSYFGCR